MNKRTGFPLKTAPLLAVGGAILLLVYTAVLRILQRYYDFRSLHNFWQPLVLLAVFLLCWGGLNLLAAPPTAPLGARSGYLKGEDRNFTEFLGAKSAQKLQKKDFPSVEGAEPAWLAKANRILLPLGIFLLAFAAFHHLSCWLGWFTTLPQTYWDQLAVSFLHGKLYLENPVYFHDLTQYQGRWYVPNPPLPAIVLVPFILALGPALNVVRISVFFAALNTLLLFFILEQAASLGWIELDRTGRLWITALFAFGTPFIYVGINGQMWFLSQTLTFTFVALAALAALAALRSWPAWVAGACLGAAVCSRPDVAVLWPFLFALYAQKIWPRQNARVWPLVSTVLQSALPILLAAAGLLLYNQARFGNWLDFGYVTINGAEQIVRDAQTYGMFNPHFVPRNLYVMFLGYPEIRAQAPFLFPSRDGMSMFLATPALIFLFRKQRLTLWKIGALVAILINLALLALYHNSGNFQFGYTYLLDFIIPLWLILAAGLGRKTPRLFAGLILLSILINLLGAFWFSANF